MFRRIWLTWWDLREAPRRSRWNYRSIELSGGQKIPTVVLWKEWKKWQWPFKTNVLADLQDDDLCADTGLHKKQRMKIQYILVTQRRVWYQRASLELSDCKSEDKTVEQMKSKGQHVQERHNCWVDQLPLQILISLRLFEVTFCALLLGIPWCSAPEIQQMNIIWKRILWKSSKWKLSQSYFCFSLWIP